MMHNRFLAKCSVSLACLVSVWGMGAYAKTTELFRFPVNIPAGVAGKDGCSTAVSTNAYGCAVLTERELVNGNCQPTSNVQTVCPGEQGDSCAIESVTQTASGRDIKFNCGGTTTTVPVENGTSCTMSLNKNATTGDVTVSKQCANESNPTTITIETSDIADEAVNKITAAGTFATTTSVTNATSTETLTSKLDGVFATQEALTSATSKPTLTTTLSGTYAPASLSDTVSALSTEVNNKVNVGALENYYTQTQVDEITTTLNAKITSAAAGVSDEHLAELIAGVVGDDYPTTSEMNTAITNATKLSALTETLSGTYAPASLSNTVSTLSNTVSGKASQSDLTALSGTVSTLSNTVSGKASQSALDTLAGRVTANETAIAALPNEERVAQIAANAANAAALCAGGRIETQESTVGGKTVVEVNCVTDD